MRHKNCRFARCNVCLEDHDLLAKYLHEKTGLSPRYTDILGKYRSWLDSKGYDSETDAGWAKPFVFEKEIVDQFLEYCSGEE